MQPPSNLNNNKPGKDNESLLKKVLRLLGILGLGVLGSWLAGKIPTSDHLPNLQRFQMAIPWILAIFFFITTSLLYLKSRGHKELEGRKNALESRKTELDAECKRLQEDYSSLEIEVKRLQEENLKLQIELPREWVGIQERTGLQGYDPDLSDSPFHPERCLPTIGKSLSFMGHGASKWTAHVPPLEDMLERIRGERNKNNSKAVVKFLILNPAHEKNTKQQRRRIAVSLMNLKFLQNEFPEVLMIRVFNHLPQFRLIFIDGKKLVVGHYGGEQRKESDNTPLHVYSIEGEWSFFHPFEEHFNTEWAAAKVPEWTEIDTIANQPVN
ncbi:MAG TPA: hypothetical protein VJ842_08665 [Pyrinomonadaceae bacterium]|nr:hypothetical protein [Pyrinomonadaceae bacterium]